MGKAHQLTEQNETAAEKIYHGDVIFSDTGEVILMSRPKAGTTTPVAAEIKSTASVSDVATLEGLEIDEPAPVPANAPAVQYVHLCSSTRAFEIICSHTSGHAHKEEYFRVNDEGTEGWWMWIFLTKTRKP